MSEVVVVGNGMVGHKLLELLIEAGHTRALHLTTFCEEPRLAYDRVNLTSYFNGKTAADLALGSPGLYPRGDVTVHLGDRAVSIDRDARCVVSAAGRRVRYDKLVLATGSSPFVPPVPGRDAEGCFVYRTLDDLEAIRRHAAAARTGVVIGGGLLGLEAANALRHLGLEVHVVELAPRLMAVQVDDAGGAMLRRKIEALGVHVHTGKHTAEICSEGGRVTRLRFADGSELATDLVVFSSGIRPRDELARSAGLRLGERGGIAIDERCVTSDPDILAIGECALFQGRCFGLVAPGYQMAKVAAAVLTGGDDRFTGADMSTKLKLMGVDVASFGDAHATEPGAEIVSYLDAARGSYAKLVLQPEAAGRRVSGGILVGDASSYLALHGLMQRRTVVATPEELILPARSGKPAAGVASLPGSATICSCLNVDKGTVLRAICDGSLTKVPEIKACTKAGTGCGSCVPLLTELLTRQLAEAGVAVSRHLCEHFAFTRQELLSLVRLGRIKSFADLLAQHGRGLGCEICKPAVASLLASAWNEHVLERRHLPLQDSNDRFLANIQRDGTYSVVPRVPAGEITPEKLIVLGEVARKYGLYTKITGAQRVDLLGARVEQLPEIWRELIAAGFESGHAYGKALRTVKSCVGSTWCRYGVQDSVSLAITLENRYKGLRSPHKLKSAVSGCARECAEAQSKDFGVIATERGYNLYLGGNGGMTPQHAQLFAVDLDEATLIRVIDRFLMFYVRTADRLQRTASWLNSLEGGLDYLKRVLLEDSLGICAELEAEMAAVVGSYQCEWRSVLEDPEKLAQFRPFVNSPASDPSIVSILERGQPRPASASERAALVPAARLVRASAGGAR